jgi:hypothetical protein
VERGERTGREERVATGVLSTPSSNSSAHLYRTIHAVAMATCLHVACLRDVALAVWQKLHTLPNNSAAQI